MLVATVVGWRSAERPNHCKHDAAGSDDAYGPQQWMVNGPSTATHGEYIAGLTKAAYGSGANSPAMRAVPSPMGIATSTSPR